MNKSLLSGPISLASRVLIALIYLLSAVGNKIPNFSSVAEYMASENVPFPQLMLVGGIVFLITGSLSIITGFRARWGAVLLLLFLILATYFFHDFWNFEGQEAQQQMIQFMKNLSLMGSMLFILANGPGAWSLDRRAATRPLAQADIS
ncbi:MAG: DoxX family protein [bacterium]|nr:DoxX family protein [bacterium]